MCVKSPDTEARVEFEHPDKTITHLYEMPAKYGRRNFGGWDRAFFEWHEDDRGLKIFPPRRVIFTTIIAGGEKPQLSPFPCWFASREMAEDVFDVTMKEWIIDKVGHLHWRKEPTVVERTVYELEFNKLVPITLYSVSARVAVDPYTPT